MQTMTTYCRHGYCCNPPHHMKGWCGWCGRVSWGCRCYHCDCWPVWSTGWCFCACSLGVASADSGGSGCCGWGSWVSGLVGCAFVAPSASPMPNHNDNVKNLHWFGQLTQITPPPPIMTIMHHLGVKAILCNDRHISGDQRFHVHYLHMMSLTTIFDETCQLERLSLAKICA